MKEQIFSMKISPIPRAIRPKTKYMIIQRCSARKNIIFSIMTLSFTVMESDDHFVALVSESFLHLLGKFVTSVEVHDGILDGYEKTRDVRIFVVLMLKFPSMV